MKKTIFQEKKSTRRLTPLSITETATQRQTKTQLENVQKRLGCKFKFAITDAGYGSEENYDYLEEKEITGIVKYTTYEKETKKSFKKKTFNTENWKAVLFEVFNYF